MKPKSRIFSRFIADLCPLAGSNPVPSRVGLRIPNEDFELGGWLRQVQFTPKAFCASNDGLDLSGRFLEDAAECAAK